MRFLGLISFILLFTFSVYGDNLDQLAENLRGKYPSLKDKDVPTFVRLLVQHQALLQNTSQMPPPSTHTPVPFTCDTFGPSPQIPTSVHQLRPSDIKVTAALGDSITAAFGALSNIILTVFTEYRGVSWSIGGDDDVSEFITLPNILKKYNPNLIGYSTGSGSEDSKNAGLNVAESGARVDSLPTEAKKLVERMKADPRIDVQNDWKVVTIWIGGNDLCDYCDDTQKHSPENYQQLVRQSLRILRDGLPRLFVNLALGIDITKLYELDGCLCGVLHYFECSCATSSDASVRAEVSQALQQYNQKLLSLREEEEFNDSDNFTVVIQPFLRDTQVPRTSDNTPDMKYFAPDCFHFSYLSHEAAAVALWNNMVEPVPTKLTKWTIGEPIECPKEGEFLYTNKNSQISSIGAQ